MEHPSRIIGLREVALAAKVSVGTASQALRNLGGTSRTTCDRVQQIARKLGYCPDPLMAEAAKRHRRGSKGAGGVPIRLVTGLSNREGTLTNALFSAVEARIGQLGYLPKSLNIPQIGQLPGLLNQWYHEGVRGVVCAHFEQPERLVLYDWSKFSVLYFGGLSYARKLHTIKSDDLWGMHLALEKAGQTGLKIGVLLHEHPKGSVLDDEIRCSLGENVTTHHPKQYVGMLRIPFALDMESQVSRVGRWFRRHRPEIVIGFSIGLAVLQSAGWRDGIDFQFLHCSMSKPKGTGALESSAELARAAAEWMDSMIRHGERGLPDIPRLLMVPPIWFDGQETDRNAQALPSPVQ